MTFKIRSELNGSVINFPEDDDGSRLSAIASELCEVLQLKVVSQGGSPLEDVVILRGKTGEFVLHWDGYMTDLKPRRTHSITDIISRLESSGKFSL